MGVQVPHVWLGWLDHLEHSLQCSSGVSGIHLATSKGNILGIPLVTVFLV